MVTPNTRLTRTVIKMFQWFFVVPTQYKNGKQNNVCLNKNSRVQKREMGLNKLMRTFMNIVNMQHWFFFLFKAKNGSWYWQQRKDGVFLFLWIHLAFHPRLVTRIFIAEMILVFRAWGITFCVSSNYSIYQVFFICKSNKFVILITKFHLVIDSNIWKTEIYIYIYIA